RGGPSRANGKARNGERSQAGCAAHCGCRNRRQLARGEVRTEGPAFEPLMQRLLARTRELIAWYPARQLLLIRDRGSDQEAELRRFHHAVEIPIVVILVRWLMVVLVV